MEKHHDVLNAKVRVRLAITTFLIVLMVVTGGLLLKIAVRESIGSDSALLAGASGAILFALGLTGIYCRVTLPEDEKERIHSTSHRTKTSGA